MIDVIHQGYQVIIRKKLPSELRLPYYISYVYDMINKFPDNLEYKVELVLVLYKLGHHTDAITQCNRIILKDPTYIKVFRNKAIILNEMGQIDEAIKALSDGIKLYTQNDQDLVDAKQTLDLLIKQQKALNKDDINPETVSDNIQFVSEDDSAIESDGSSSDSDDDQDIPTLELIKSYLRC
jgi:tetratricopeptide (TPR) repeat protein